ncbi:MAG: flagellar biosynthesis protein FlhA [Planctomycetales bacterium]|nr:flagellar biosynthesis protein FlhA [Planctomycetales bacterium]
MSRLNRIKDLILPIGIITSVLVIMVPLPSSLMDLLLAANITVSVIILLTTIYVKTPLEFNVFPSLLLASTLARLVLNVATTRLILTGADGRGMLAAGGVIKSFGEFVAGDKIVIGVVLFVIIVVIQFVVITKGATRISEVAARFALDGMPGRQMAIDADLNAGIIDEHEAQRRRQDITRQADFYGAMDGASKFVRGDAIAGIIITLINIVGGLVIGMVEYGMTVSEAAEIFTKLTIGDGLVSQVPAFLVSLAAGLLVTRSTQEVSLPTEFLGQLFSRPQALFVAGGFLSILVFTSLPTVPLLAIGGGCVGLAFTLMRKEKQVAQQAVKKASAAAVEAAKPKEDRIEDYLAIDPMEMEIGVDLIKLADPNRGGDLLTRITGVRKNVAAEMGVVLPKVRIRDNQTLPPNAYRIRIANNPVAVGDVYPGRLLAIASGMDAGQIEGVAVRDPAFGQPAVWIEHMQRDEAMVRGFTPVEPSSVLATHLQEVSKQHADELLTRDATKHLVDELKAISPAVVDELIPKVMSLAQVQQVLQLLLRERISIRPLATILETLGDFGGKTNDPALLNEFVRQRLARHICSQYRDHENKLHVLTMDPAMENRLASGVDANAGMMIRMSPPIAEQTVHRIALGLEKAKAAGTAPILLVTNPTIRPGVKQLTVSTLPRLVVLSANEITRDTIVEPLGMVTDVEPAKPAR